MGARSDATDDPFPRERATELVTRLPAYARLALAVARDERLPPTRRAALVGAGTYAISPIGLVPGFVPLLGQLDDLWILLRALRFALDGLGSDAREGHLADSGISEQDLDADLRSVTEMGAWTTRRVREATARASTHGIRISRRIAGNLGRTVTRLTGTVGRDSIEPVEDRAGHDH